MCHLLIAQGGPQTGRGCCVLTQSRDAKTTRDYIIAKTPHPPIFTLMQQNLHYGVILNNSFLLESIIHTNLMLNYPSFLDFCLVLPAAAAGG